MAQHKKGKFTYPVAKCSNWVYAEPVLSELGILRAPSEHPHSMAHGGSALLILGLVFGA